MNRILITNNKYYMYTLTFSMFIILFGCSNSSVSSKRINEVEVFCILFDQWDRMMKDSTLDPNFDKLPKIDALNKSRNGSRFIKVKAYLTKSGRLRGAERGFQLAEASKVLGEIIKCLDIVNHMDEVKSLGYGNHEKQIGNVINLLKAVGMWERIEC